MSHSVGKIVENAGSQVTAWDPTLLLEKYGSAATRYSRGFLRVRSPFWFRSLEDKWNPFFDRFGVGLSFQGITLSLGIPTDLVHASTFEVEQELGIIGMDATSIENLKSVLLVDVDGGGSVGREASTDQGASVDQGESVFGNKASTGGAGFEVLLAYLERRILTTLVAAWAGPELISCQHVSSVRTEQADIVGTICLELEVSGKSVNVCFGLGPKFTAVLDSRYRELTRSKLAAEPSIKIPPGDSHVSIELAELIVPAASLIDFVRPGVVIDSEVAVDSEVLVRLNGSPWFKGKLRNVNNKLAVEVLDMDSLPVEQGAGTRVQVRVADYQLSRDEVLEHSQVGAVLLSDTQLESKADLVISGEKVARAVIGQIGENFSLNVLPK